MGFVVGNQPPEERGRKLAESEMYLSGDACVSSTMGFRVFLTTS